MGKVYLAEWHWEGPVHRHKDRFQLVVECYPKSDVAHGIPSIKAIASAAASNLSSLCLSNWLCLPNPWLSVQLPFIDRAALLHSLIALLTWFSVSRELALA